MINILGESLVNKIAAGEVVERPGSVVKELAENSIDAGASVITVEIRNGGCGLIRVSDNGCGIERADARRAFLQHATSKIVCAEDLDAISTMGFRGEALASVAAVSQVEMTTKARSEITGTRLEIHGGEVIRESETGAADGTSIIVRNLFYNVPARRKFLKKQAAESGFVADVVSRLALSRPEIKFTYINNGATSFQTDGTGSLKSAVWGIFGRDAANETIEIAYESGGLSVFGLVGTPQAARASRNHETLFINGRYIRSPMISSAVEAAAREWLMVGKFPFFVLNLEIPPNRVDVNVHPAKLEARFDDEKMIYDLFFDAVTEGYNRDKAVVVPRNPLAARSYPASQGAFAAPAAEELDIFDVLPPYDEEGETYDAGGAFGAISVSEASYAYQVLPPASHREARPAEERKPPFFHNYSITGQIFATYWIVEQDGKIYLVDQHAAHEKILYEEFLQNARSGKIVTQRLLAPQAIKLTDAETDTVHENLGLLNKLGYDLEEFGDNVFAVRGVPYIFSRPAEAGFIVEIIDKLSIVGEKTESLYDERLDKIATQSCKAAVKGNDRLSYIEAKALLERFLRAENPFNCPHGRPTVVEISKHEIERMFKRT